MKTRMKVDAGRIASSREKYSEAKRGFRVKTRVKAGGLVGHGGGRIGRPRKEPAFI
jgi:hypothetical protein